MNLIFEFMRINSYYQLFKHIERACIFSKIERNVYNKRKQKLFSCLERLRKKLTYAFYDYISLGICKIVNKMKKSFTLKIIYV